MPLTFSQDKRGGEIPIEDAQLNEFWESPAVNSWGQMMNRAEFIFATVAWYKLSGNAFWVMDDSWLDPRIKNKSPLIIVRPDRMLPIYGRAGKTLMGWRFTDGDGVARNLIPEQVVHHRAFDPSDDVLGLPEWLAVKVAAESDYSAGKFAKSIMDNNGDRGPFVIAKSGVPSDEQREQIERALRSKREMSRRGDFRAMFLTGDITVEDPSVQAVDAAFVGQRLENRHEIYIGLGVPASFAEVAVSYSVGSASDRYRLIEETCMPLGSKIADGIETVSKNLLRILPRTGKTLYAEFDWDNHSTMQQVRRERTNEAKELWGTGVPWTVLNNHLDLRLPRFAGDDVARVPFSMKDVNEGQKQKDKGESAAAPASKTNAIDELESLFKQWDAEACDAGCCAGKKSHAKSNNKESFEQSAEDVALWEMLQSKRKPWENKFERKFNRLLFSARAETLQNIRNSYVPAEKAEKTIARKSALELVFDLADWMDAINSAMGELTEQAVIEAGGQWVTDEAELAEAIELPSVAVQSVVQNRQNMLSRSSTEMWHEIREAIADGISEGDSINDLENRIRAKFNDMSKVRARRIAVTETAVAFEQGRFLTMKEAGVTHKRWVTASDNNVRDTHRAVNGEVLPIDELFIVGYAELLHPADPNGLPEEVINCATPVVRLLSTI
jgi:HK97 family phage portal protein